MLFATWRRVLAPLAVGLTVVGVVAVSATAAPATQAAGAAPSVEIKATSMTLAQLLTPPASAQPQYFPPNLVLDTTWVTQTATEPDPSTSSTTSRVTGRTWFMAKSAISAGVTKYGSISCVGQRTSNPTSDHPSGRACDLMFDPKTPAGVEAGWRAANWLIANQSVLGVKYLIWQGLYWGAGSRVNPWNTYVSTAYGCPNPANLTGCHYDHVHVSMY